MAIKIGTLTVDEAKSRLEDIKTAHDQIQVQRDTITETMRNLRQQLEDLEHEDRRLVDETMRLNREVRTVRNAAEGKCQQVDKADRFSVYPRYCEKPAKTEGLCGLHYNARIKRGY